MLKDSRHVLIIVLHPISIIERIPIIGSIVFLDIAEVVPAIQGATVTHDCLQMVQIPNAFFILSFRLRKLETVGTFQDLVEVEDLSEFALAVYLSHWSILAKAETIDVDLQNRWKFRYPNKLPCVLFPVMLVVVLVLPCELFGLEQTQKGLLYGVWLLEVDLKDGKSLLSDAFVVDVDAFDYVLFFTKEEAGENWFLCSALDLLFQVIVEEQLEFRGILLYIALLRWPAEWSQQFMRPYHIELQILSILQVEKDPLQC